MGHSRSRRQLSHLVVALLFLGFGSIPRIVLCVDAGGHRAIELLNAACCRPDARPAEAGVVRVHDGSCAEECTDTPLDLGFILRSPDGSSQQISLAVPVAGSFLDRDWRSNLRPLHLEDGVGPSLLLGPRHLRTTVNLR